MMYLGDKAVGITTNITLIEPQLPDGYVRIPYLRATGTQYIDTQQPFDNDWELSATAVYEYNNNYHNLYGIDGTFLQCNAAGEFAYIYWGSKPFGYSTSCVIDNLFICKTGLYFQDDIVGPIQLKGIEDATAQNLSLAIFARHKPNDIYDYPFTGRLYHLKIKKNNNIEHWYVPTKRVSDNQLGLYDLITRQFYINIGTGDFTTEES